MKRQYEKAVLPKHETRKREKRKREARNEREPEKKQN